MEIEVIHARILSLLQSEGSISGVAKKLRKTHSSVLHAMKTLENETGLQIFDRSQYRTSLTHSGGLLLRELTPWLEQYSQVQYLVQTLKLGHEPDLKVIYDGSLSFAPILSAVQELKQQVSQCQVSLHVGHLTGVVDQVVASEASVGLTVIKNRSADLQSVRVGSLTLEFVGASRQKSSELPWVVVQGLPEEMQPPGRNQPFVVSDFYSKKEILLSGFGVGWMPSHLVAHEIKKKSLVRLSPEKKMDVYLINSKRTGRSRVRELFLKFYLHNTKNNV